MSAPGHNQTWRLYFLISPSPAQADIREHYLQAKFGPRGDITAPNSRSSIIRYLSDDTWLARTVPSSRRVEEIEDGGVKRTRSWTNVRCVVFGIIATRAPAHARQGPENYRQ